MNQLPVRGFVVGPGVALACDPAASCEPSGLSLATEDALIGELARRIHPGSLLVVQELPVRGAADDEQFTVVVHHRNAGILSAVTLARYAQVQMERMLGMRPKQAVSSGPAEETS